MWTIVDNSGQNFSAHNTARSTSRNTILSTYSTWIYTPGNRPEKFSHRSIPAGVGRILDLEDSIPAQEKNAARDNITSFLAHLISTTPTVSTTAPDPIAVRVNDPQTQDFAADLAAITPYLDHIYVVIPKVAKAHDIALITQITARAQIIPMVESPNAVVHLPAILDNDAVVGVMFGAADMSCELDIAADWESLLFIRQMILLQAKAHQLPIWDSPYFQLDDHKGLRAEAEQACKLGFTGKLSIHPHQIAPIMSTFSPTPQQVTWAKNVLATLDQENSVGVIDGEFVDTAMAKKAHNILLRAQNAQ